MERLSTTAEGSNAEFEIQDVLAAYEMALNASDVDAVLDVFTADGVFMAPNNPSAVGADALRVAYSGIFQTITFDTELHVDEVTQIAPDWAVVRTHSAGSVTVTAIGQRVPDANHELFVFRKEDGRWKIARYAFATTLPLTR